MAMVPKQPSGATSAEYQQVLDENDALRAEIVKLKLKISEIRSQLENCQMIREEQAGYIRGLWEDNQRVHAELRFCNRQQEKERRP